MDDVANLSALSRFSLIMGRLRAAVAARAHIRKVDRWSETALPGPLVTLIWQRLRRIETQLLHLAALFRAGRLRSVPNRRPPARPPTRRPAPSPYLSLPRHFAWLCPLVPYEAAPYGGQLSVVLAEPEMVALIAASPRARRILRPLCRMLAMAPSLLTPTPPAPADTAQAAIACDDRTAAPAPPRAEAAPPGTEPPKREPPWGGRILVPG